eukprot:3604410-Rhodomonas_salina.1
MALRVAEGISYALSSVRDRYSIRFAMISTRQALVCRVRTRSSLPRSRPRTRRTRDPWPLRRCAL